MRKHAAWYLKGIRGNGIIRNAINQVETAEELRAILNNVVEQSREQQEREMHVV
jgi:tRNA-dihydrouridine synthase